MKSPRRILDTSMLIGHWHGCHKRSSHRGIPTSAQEWARELIELHDTRANVTPVEVEFLAGVRSRSELELARSFLSAFEIADQGKVLAEDWEQAKRLAARVPADGKPRQLGDCLIRAIAIRLKCDVRTQDKDFPRA